MSIMYRQSLGKEGGGESERRGGREKLSFSLRRHHAPAFCFISLPDFEESRGLADTFFSTSTKHKNISAKMVEMTGTYERTAAEKYDEFLTALGVNMLLRKAATASTPKMEVRSTFDV